MRTISKAQRWKILELWTAVCKDRGWKTGDRALRLATIGKILGRELTTLDNVGRLEECTKVLAELGCMLGNDLRAGLEATDPKRNAKRNWRWLIANETLPCLAIYPLDAPMGAAGAQAYLIQVLTDKSRYRKTDRPESEPSLADFDERTVQQIFWTLHARLQVKRKAAAHTGHDMCLAAGIPCKCAPCSRARAWASAVPIVPPLPAMDRAEESADALVQEDPDWTV